MNYNQEDLPYIKIPLHTLIELTPKAYHCEEKRYKGNNIIYIQIYNTLSFFFTYIFINYIS